jgi:hypothetical protein
MQNKKERRCAYKRIVEALLRNYCCSGKATSITYCECVFVALGIQHAIRMHYIVICELPALKYFSTLSHKRLYFSKKKEVIGNNVCIISTICVRKISHSKKNWARCDQQCVLVS